MAAGYVIRKNQYYDSVFLMRVAKTLLEEPGVQECAVLMATDANKERLAELGFNSPEVMGATANDLVIGILADDASLIDRLLGEMDARLTSRPQDEKSSIYRSIEDASAAYPQSNLVVITVPGAYAAREARKALEQGKHVFLFSDNVPLDQEVELKQLAKARRRLVMGPDCGTSLIGGIGIGFANRVRRGRGGSGRSVRHRHPGVHQPDPSSRKRDFPCHWHRQPRSFGCGGRDHYPHGPGYPGSRPLNPGDRADFEAFWDEDAGDTPGTNPADRRKPVVGCLLGLDQRLDCGPNFYQVSTIDQAVEQALICMGASAGVEFLHQGQIDRHKMEREVQSWLPEQRYLRGLFAGGTFCYQAQQVLQSAGIPVYSNSPLDSRYQLEKSGRKPGAQHSRLRGRLFHPG